MEGQTQSSETVEFTHRWYGEFLDRIRAEGYEFRPFSDDVGEGDVVLRHDVDLSLEDAVAMAELEADRDVQSTYCVLLTAALYNPVEYEQRERLQEIVSLGHDVALHFSTHEYWDDGDPPDEVALEAALADERSVLETLVHDVGSTVSFHAPPEWVLGRSFDGFRNAYAPAYFGDIDYVADSGQRWRETPPSVEDLGDAAQVLTHPGLWTGTDGSFASRVDRGVTAACRHANAKAQRELLQSGESQ